MESERLGDLVLGNVRLPEQMLEKTDLQGLAPVDRHRKPYPAPGFTVDMMASVDS